MEGNLHQKINSKKLSSGKFFLPKDALHSSLKLYYVPSLIRTNYYLHIILSNIFNVLYLYQNGKNLVLNCYQV